MNQETKKYDEDYLNALISKAKKSWEGVDVESYMSGLRDNDMKTIEERAKANLAYEQDFCGHSLSENMVCRSYVRGATEQKAIDEAKLLKLKSAWEKEAQINHDDEANRKQGYHDAIEKACEWLEENARDYAYATIRCPYGEEEEIICDVHREIVEDFRKAMEK